MNDKEFSQYINDTGYYDLLNMDGKDIVIYKNTLHYLKWQLGKAREEFTKAICETKLGSMIISLIEFLDKCIEKIF